MSSEQDPTMNVGVVGGGIMGLSLAYRLAKSGHAVTVFERSAQLGGLATYHNFGPFYWDRFYHVILPSDSYLIRFVNDIGLGDRLRWQRTLTGVYVDRNFYSVSTMLEFLRFPLVGFLGKARLAFTILYCAYTRNWRRLEKIPVEDFLIHLSGRNTYEKFWKPLLLAKLGVSYRRVSAVFIWSYIKRLFSARDSSAKKESLGYVSGGYKTVITRLEQAIRSCGGAIRTEVSVNRVSPAPTGGLYVEVDGKRHRFDKVVFTSPVNVLQAVAEKGLVDVSDPSGEVEYLGVICMVLITRRPLVPYYVVNIADERIPFTGVIGMSSLVSTDETAGLYLTYLPKYVLSTDPLLRESDEQIRGPFLEAVRLMFPNFRAQDIYSIHIHRALKVQPLQVINYSSLVPKVTTAHPDFFVLNTAQFVNNTLNNNEVIRTVDEFLLKHGSQFEVTRKEMSQSRAMTA
jgi:protoporphyrinogen oxidase